MATIKVWYELHRAPKSAPGTWSLVGKSWRQIVEPAGERIGTSFRVVKRGLAGKHPPDPVPDPDLVPRTILKPAPHTAARSLSNVNSKSAVQLTQLGLTLLVTSAWMHYCLTVPVDKIIAWLRTICRLEVSAGGLTQMWGRLAERMVRPAAAARKVCYGNRSWEAAYTQSMLMSVFQTLRLRGENPVTWTLDHLKRQITGNSNVVAENDVEQVEELLAA